MRQHPTEDKPPSSWRKGVVLMNYRNRSVSWFLAFCVLAAHLSENTAPAWVWWALVLQFLVYPHAMFLRARRAPDSLKAEMNNVRLDALCFGVWVGALGFPLWIVMLLLIPSAMSVAVFRGVKGLGQALALQALGGLGAVGLMGWRFAPDASLLVALLSMASLALYLIMFSLSANGRAVKLYRARNQLRENELTLRNQLAEIQLLQTQLKDEAEHDHLTGLYNRRYLSATLGRELARCHREKSPLSVMMIDLDHFKQINDQHGHPFGDEVLATVAQTLSTSLRAGDIACRYGGEEFLLTFPNMCCETAMVRAKELRQKVEGLEIWANDRLQPVRISIGLADAPRDSLDAQALIARADKALYQAKAMGRNRVVVANELDP